jgi:hypothetical protein
MSASSGFTDLKHRNFCNGTKSLNKTLYLHCEKRYSSPPQFSLPVLHFGCRGEHAFLRGESYLCGCPSRTGEMRLRGCGAGRLLLGSAALSENKGFPQKPCCRQRPSGNRHCPSAFLCFCMENRTFSCFPIHHAYQFSPVPGERHLSPRLRFSHLRYFLPFRRTAPPLY